MIRMTNQPTVLFTSKNDPDSRSKVNRKHGNQSESTMELKRENESFHRSHSLRCMLSTFDASLIACRVAVLTPRLLLTSLVQPPTRPVLPSLVTFSTRSSVEEAAGRRSVSIWANPMMTRLNFSKSCPCNGFVKKSASIASVGQ